ncbi:META domain-containing protein [Methanosarcina sp. Mfa9]|uniref:META domain-containing protein n=1 Tax=Methanosarcina sp. Mfa9 TaxID=3439063 RepID=UPI003F84EDC2
MMKMKNMSIYLVLLLTIGLITVSAFSLGCTEQEETPLEPAETIPSEPETISPEEITGIEWQWTGLLETNPTAQSVVPDPENYTLVLFPDGTYSIKADCNRGSGGYTLEGNTLTLGTGPMTLAACGPDSLYDQYVTLLFNVKSAAMENGQLTLYSGDNGDKMFFSNGGQVEA